MSPGWWIILGRGQDNELENVGDVMEIPFYNIRET
jgi:hypothetical protein